MVLTKPLLSLFICLVICIAHPSHSFPNSHVMHKRMEKTFIAARMVGDAIPGSGFAAHESGSVGAAGGLDRTNSAALRLQHMNQQELHSNRPEAKSFARKSFPTLRSSIGSINAWRRRIWQSLMGTFRRFFTIFSRSNKETTHLESPAGLKIKKGFHLESPTSGEMGKNFLHKSPDGETGERLYRDSPRGSAGGNEGALHQESLGEETEEAFRRESSSASQMAKTLHHESPDGHVAEFPQKLAEDRPHPENVVPKYDPSLDFRIKQPLHNSQKILEELNEMEKRVAEQQNVINRHISGMLPEPRENVDAVQVIGKNMANYLTEVFDKDRRALQAHLPQELKYLSKIHGFMGPRDVFESLVKLGLKDYFQKGELVAEDFEKELYQVVKNMKDIQYHLANMARLHRSHDLSQIKPESGDEVKLHHILDYICKDETLLVERFGCAELERAFEAVENMGFYEQFTHELRNPSSPLGYQLQFLQPYGHMHQYADIPDGDLIYERFGITHDEGYMKILKIQGDSASKNIKKSIELAADLARETQNMYKVLTPEELENVLQYLKTIPQP